jgi:hypothetical protein
VVKKVWDIGGIRGLINERKKYYFGRQSKFKPGRRKIRVGSVGMVGEGQIRFYIATNTTMMPKVLMKNVAWEV